ncbi:hypothetical protein ACEPAH_2475 [Sanghuangporus vaninii]
MDWDLGSVVAPLHKAWNPAIAFASVLPAFRNVELNSEIANTPSSGAIRINAKVLRPRSSAIFPSLL